MIVFKPPNITGRTQEEKLDQLIRYLRELAQKLQQLQQQ